MATNLYLYLHTHWDREWYWSFGAYRTQLVTVIKNILSLLENGALEKFMLDGQTALIEDAMEVSPGLGQRIKKMVQAGKLSIGPWYVLADQMLVGGESLVRNLHYGLALSEMFGGATRVGYCPDTFGHSADLPRILKGFNIDCAVVWRGVPPLALSPLFDWRSPDGSEVLTLDLTQGYYQSAFGEELETSALARQLLSFVGLAKQSDGTVEEIDDGTINIVPQLQGALYPVGADHVGPQADFNKQLQAALFSINGTANNAVVSAEVVSLQQFFEKVRAAADPAEPVRLVTSELRDNSRAFEYARAYMLDGVLSARLYLKRENRLSEYKMLRQAEPFRALLAVHNILPYCLEELDFNWKLLLKNHPHDSICGCSIDAVHREMQTRSASLNDSLDLLLAQGKEALIKMALSEREATLADARFGARHLDIVDPQLAFERLLVFNPSASPYSGPVRVRLGLEEGKETKLPAGFQQLSMYSATETFIGLSQVPVFKEISVVEGYLDAGIVPAGTLQSIELAQNSKSVAAAGAVNNGRAAAGACNGENADAFNSIELSNEFFTVFFDKDGVLTVQQKNVKNDGAARGAKHKLGHRLVDVADAGDTYNFDPVAQDKPAVARLVSVSPGKNGPLVASLIAHYQIDLPEGLVAKGTLGKKGEAENAPQLTVFERAKVRIPHKIESEIILKKGVPILFFETTMQNSASDHRLEAIFDLAAPVEFTLSENHFALIKRYHDKNAALHPLVSPDDLIALGHEAPLSRYPNQRFFVAGGNVFLNAGLPEYGVGDSAVSITLLRAVSYLSRKRLRTRGGGAGPIMPTPEANCPWRMHTSYAWAPSELAATAVSEPVSEEAAPFVLADLFEGYPLAFISPAGGVADKSLSLFAISNQSIRITASYIEADGKLVIRLLNATSQSLNAFFTPAAAVQSVYLGNLDGSDLKELKAGKSAGGERQFELAFKPCQLITLFCTI